MKRGHMILSAFFFNPQGDHRMSWRHPRAPGREVLDFDYYRELVQAAEARQDRHHLRRRPRLDLGLVEERRRALRQCPPRTADALVGAGRRDQAYRPDHHGVELLQRALQCGAHVRLARPYQQGQGGVERRHLGDGRGGAEFRPRRQYRTRLPL